MYIYRLGVLYPFLRKIHGKDLTAMTVDATILTARHGTINQSINQSVVSLRLFAKPFSAKIPHNFTENHETMMLTDTGGLCL